MNDILGLLCFLLLVLIAVISSKRIQRSVGKIFEWVVYIGLKSVLFFLFGIIVIIGLWLLITWGWDKLHEIYPNMWSLKEIIQTGLLFAGLIAVCAFIKFVDDKLKNKYGEDKVKKIYNGIGTVFGHIIIDSLAFTLVFIILASFVGLAIYVFGLYLLIKYSILIFIKRKRQNRMIGDVSKRDRLRKQ